MKASISTSLPRVLGPDWSLKAEHAAAFDIAARLKADGAARLIMLLGLTVLSMWIVHPAISLAWCFLILQHEWVNRRFAFHQRLDAPFGSRQLFRLILQSTSGTLFWVIGALVFIAGESSHRLLGLTLLIGIMVHVSLLYNTSRIQTLTTGLSCLAGFVGATIITLLDPQLTLDHKVITIFAIIAIFGYMMTATIQNLKIRDRLKNLLSEKTRLAAEDPLTGLQNRRSFVELVAAQKSTGRPLTLVFIDLDRFKPLNDQFGHAVGDQVLMEIGRRLNEQPDMLGAARLGGDEFAALFAAPAEAHPADLQILALHNCLTAPIQSVSGDVSVGASMGWVRAGGESTSVSEVLHSADVAMRRAKVEHLGVAEFDPVIDQAALASSAIEIAFRHALSKGRIRTALQPIVSVRSG